MKTFDHGFDNEKGKGKIKRKKENSNRAKVFRYVASLNQEQISRMMENSANQFAQPHVDATGRSIMRNSMNPQNMTVQAKLEISQPGDSSEMQADKVADAVSRGDVNMSRMAMQQTGSEINAKGEGGTLTTTPEFNQQLESSKGSGSKMDEGTKSEMEHHMGADLSGVNIHTGSTASTMSENINAKAFTHGQDVYFKDGNYNPKSSEGKNLLAHELTHTQQQKGGVQPKIQRQVDPSTHAEFKQLKNFYEATITTEEGAYLLHDVPLITDKKPVSTDALKSDVLIPSGQIVEVQWESNTGWLFVYYPGKDKKGYLKRQQIFATVTLDAVVIEDMSVNKSKIDQLDKYLNKFNVPENDVQNLMKTFTAGERKHVLDKKDTYRSLFTSCMTNKEMRNVVMILQLPLTVKLDWMIEEGTDFQLVASLTESITMQDIDAYLADTKLQTRLADAIGTDNATNFREALSAAKKGPSSLSSEAFSYRKRKRNRKGIYGAVMPNFGELNSRYQKLTEKLEGTESIYNYLYIYPDIQNKTFPPNSDPRQNLTADQKKALPPWFNKLLNNYVKELKMAHQEPSYPDRVLSEELTIHGFVDKADYEATEASFQTFFTDFSVAVAQQMLNVNEKIIVGEVNRYFGDEAVQTINKAMAGPRALFLEADALYDAYYSSNALQPGEQIKKQNKWEEKKKQAEAAAKVERDKLKPTFPILEDKNIDNATLAKADVASLRKTLTQTGLDRLEDVQTTRDNLKSTPNMVYDLENVIAQSKSMLGFKDDGSNVYALILKRHEVERDWSKSAINTAKLVFAIGLGLLSAPIGGWEGFVVGAAATGLGAQMTIEQIGEYKMMHAAAGTAFDRAKALTSNDPSLFWLAVSIAATILDLGLLTRTFFKLAQSKNLFKGIPSSKTKDAFKQEVDEIGKEAGLTDDAIKTIEQAVDSKVAGGATDDIGDILWDGVAMVDDGVGGKTRNVLQMFGGSGAKVEAHCTAKAEEIAEYVLGKGGTKVDAAKWNEVLDALRKTDLAPITKNKMAGGIFWERINVIKYENAGYEVFHQVVLRDTASGTEAVLDIFAKKGANDFLYVECKVGGAKLSDEQKLIYNLLETNPTQVKGIGTNAKLAFGDNIAPPKLKVDIIRGEGI